MQDATVKALVIAGLLVQSAAVALGFTSAGWRWPVAGATAAVALGVLVVCVAENDLRHGLGRGIALVAVLALVSSGAHAASASPVAAWSARIFFGVEFLFQALILLFLLFFRMNRLW